MFERFSKLLGELQLHGKHYDKKEVNLKFLLTLPTHLESRVMAIRDGRNLNNVSLETLYGVLKSYELEYFQKRAIQCGLKNKMANMSNALIAHDPRISQQGEPSHAFQQIQPPTLKIEEVEDEDDKVIVELEDDDEDEFYTLEEMENMDNPAMDFMATNFKIFKFKKNKAFRAQGQYSKFNRTGSNKDTGGNSGGGYKSGMVDRSKFKCFNYGELGHFVGESKGQSNSEEETKSLAVKARKVKEEHMLLKARAGKKLMKKRMSRW